MRGLTRALSCETAHLPLRPPGATMEKKTVLRRGEEKDMRRRGKERFCLTVSVRELRLLLAVMLWYRNRVLREGKPAEDINNVILEIAGAMGN